MAASIRANSPHKTQQDYQIAPHAQDEKVSAAAKRVWEVNQLQVQAFHQLVQAVLDDKSSFTMDDSLGFGQLRLSQKTSLNPPKNSPDVSAAAGLDIPPMDSLPPTVESSKKNRK